MVLSRNFREKFKIGELRLGEAVSLNSSGIPE
jgi:hypothetical protein